LRKLDQIISWPDNVWMGVTVENNDCLFRIEDLRNTAAKIKFISFEPLLDRISNPDLRGINWVIPFFFKQWGGFNKTKNGRTIDGRTWDEMPLSSN
jgi:protein gp37